MEVTSISFRISVGSTGRSSRPGDLRRVGFNPNLGNEGICRCISCVVLHSSKPMRRPRNLPNVYKQDWHWHCPTATQTSTVHNANFRHTTESITYKLRNCIRKLSLVFFYGTCSPIAGCDLPIIQVFRDHTQRRTTVGRTPLDEWSARRRDLYLTTHNIHNRQTSMPPVGFEPKISAGERTQTYALDRAATGTGYHW